MFIRIKQEPTWVGERSIGFDVTDGTRKCRVFIPLKMTNVVDDEMYVSDWIVQKKLDSLPAEVGSMFQTEYLDFDTTIEEEPLPDGGVFPEVIALFDKAAEGIKYPKLRFDLDGHKVIVKRAGDRSKTPGALFLDDGADFRDKDRKYYGKIDRDGVFTPGRACFEELVALLSEMNDDGAETIAEYGRNSGNCMVCEAALTVDESVERGMGPVCFKRWAA